MRVAHVTDIHVYVHPTVGELVGKRLLGTANLELRGRKHHFTREIQEALVPAVLAQAPDAVICTGDLTAQGTPAEFQAALELLEPLFDSVPSAVIPGNHDTYTLAVARAASWERWFGRWAGCGSWPRTWQLGPDVAAVGLQTCRAHLLSSGHLDRDQLARLDSLLPQVQASTLFVLLHYPLRGRHGEPYGPFTRNLAQAAALEGVLQRHAHRITAVLHGHEHHGFRTEAPGGIPILNPGSAGYAWLPQKGRTAHFNVYEVHGNRVDVSRFRYDGPAHAFVPEPGGAYASGG